MLNTDDTDRTDKNGSSGGSADWILRVGRAADVPAMYGLDCECFEEPFRFDLASMRRFAGRRGAIVVVAEIAGELAGFVIVHMERRTGYVVTLDVAARFRRMGFARELMDSAEAEARGAGATGMALHVYVGNDEAVAFYERCGWLRVGREASFYGEGLDAWMFEKAFS